jgi:hypothetical protein
MIRKIILITYLAICWSHYPAMARDPNLPEPSYYGGQGIFGGPESWTFADTWVVCGVATVAVLIYALPRIFDGPDGMNHRFHNEGRPGFSPFGDRRFTSSGCRGDRWAITRLTVNAPMISGEFRTLELSVRPKAARFKFPTRRLQESLVR